MTVYQVGFYLKVNVMLSDFCVVLLSCFGLRLVAKVLKRPNKAKEKKGSPIHPHVSPLSIALACQHYKVCLILMFCLSIILIVTRLDSISGLLGNLD